jgi:hypothetical protein
MLKVEDLGERPVKVERDVRGFLEEVGSRVRQDSPDASPVVSTANA